MNKIKFNILETVINSHIVEVETNYNVDQVKEIVNELNATADTAADAFDMLTDYKFNSIKANTNKPIRRVVVCKPNYCINQTKFVLCCIVGDITGRLRHGKMYPVIREDIDTYTIKDDEGDENPYSKYRFEVVEVVR